MFKYGFSTPQITVSKELITALRSGVNMRVTSAGIEVVKITSSLNRHEVFLFDSGKVAEVLPNINPDYSLDNSILPAFLKVGDIFHIAFQRDNSSDMISFSKDTVGAVSVLYLKRGKKYYKMPLVAIFMTKEEADGLQ